MSSRTYHDPLHGAIRLDRHHPAEALAIQLIDTPPFQRLRRIRQLGPAYLTFHGAESSRFTHSLGVLQLARRALAELCRREPRLEQEAGVLFAAALLHDVGHGPLSHSGEEMYGLHHEQWSARLIREHPSLREPLEAMAPGSAELVADLLEHGRYRNGAIKALVSSQLDCDRLDYLLRDSYSTGTSYGQLDLERILASLTLAPDGQLALHPKGLMAVEHYLVVRNLMYRSVYNHRLNVVCNWLLTRSIAVARQLGPEQVWADAVMQRWREEGPTDLQELCTRLLDRRLLRASNVSQIGNGRRLELLALARRLSEQAGLKPDLCCGLQSQQNRGYHPYRGGLRLWDGQQLTALEQRSALVQSLSSATESAWLIHPPEITVPLRQELAMETSAEAP